MSCNLTKQDLVKYYRILTNIFFTKVFTITKLKMLRVFKV